MANKKGQVLIDVYLILFCIIFLFLVFFAIVPKENKSAESILTKIIITENAISKTNITGIGFAKYNLDAKTVMQNTLENPKIIEPIKNIKIVDYITQNVVFGDDNIDCKKQTNIERLVLYNDEIAKAIFYFCE